jgi:transcriptional regulator with AAA-type ATPase domain
MEVPLLGLAAFPTDAALSARLEAAARAFLSEDLPPHLTAPVREVFGEPLERRESLRRFTARYVRLVLHRCSYNKREACRRLDISYHTLQTCLRHVQDLESREQPALPAGGDADDAGPGPLQLGATLP